MTHETGVRLLTLRPINAVRLLTKRRAWYDGEGGSGGEHEDKPTETQPDKDAEKGTSEGQLSQEQVNKLVGEARKKGRETGLADLLKELGVDDAAALKTFVADAKQRAEAELTEVQKAQAAREKAEKEAADAKAQLEAEQRARREDRRNGRIAAAADKAGAVDHADVLAWALGQGDLLTATMNEAGAVDDKAVEKLIADARKAKPHFFKSGGPGSPSQRDGRSPTNDPEELRKRTFGNRRARL